MDQRLKDYLNGRAGDYVTPFYWQHGSEKRQISIPDRVRQLYEDGNRSFCVESRPHPNFCKDEWWADMALLMESARKLNMKVWIMDTKHYPTGYISGFDVNHPELRMWNIAENHADVIGPVTDGMLLIEQYTPDDIILDVYAYPRLSERENELGRNPIRLTDGVQNGAVYFDLPAGNWRVITLLQTHKGVSDSFISVIDDDSVQILIDEVYEPHYQHLKEYIGNTFVGFFSDEPRYRNQQVASVRWQYGYYDKTVGQRGMGLPYNQEVLSMMEAELKIPARELLAALWYDIKGMTEKVRLAYMNAISILYGKHFSLKIGEWCHQHGLMYMGHVQEDMGVHARTGNGCSHFYRCQWGQDYSGIDVVLHQVLPGFAHLNSYSKDAYMKFLRTSRSFTSCPCGHITKHN